MGEKIGKVVHYFNDISVSVIELSDDLEVGDAVTFVSPGGEELFEQTIDSMEIDHDSVKEAGSGDEVAVKVDQKAKEGVDVHKSE
jgi:translation elongation factor EF-1alpha